MKTILGGAIGGLTGFLVSHFVVTYKRVKEEMCEREELVSDLNKFVEESEVVVNALRKSEEAIEKALPVRRKQQVRESSIKDIEEGLSITVSEYETVDPAIVDISEVEAAALNAEEQMAENAIQAVCEDLPDYHAIVADINNYTEEELEYLRHDVNSPEAYIQFKASRLAHIQEGNNFATLMTMFDTPFVPVSTEDEIVHQHIVEAREEFFTADSIFTNAASMAELYLHFAELMSQDFGESIDHFMHELLLHSELDARDGILFEQNMHRIMTHEAYTRYGYGMFGLFQRDEGYDSKSFMKQYNSNRYFQEENE